MANIDESLAKLSGTWKNAEAPAQRVLELPAGSYQVKIDKPRIEESKNSGRLQIAWPLTVLSGDHKNSTVTKYDGLETEKNIGFVKQTFGRLGLAIPSSPLGIKDALVKADGIMVEIKVVNKDDFTNIYFQKLITNEELAPKRESL